MGFRLVEATEVPRPTAAECLLNGGYADLALPYLVKDVEKQPNSSKEWNNLGVCQKYIGNYAEAERCLLRAQEIDPKASPPVHNLGLVFEEQGEFKKALREFGRAATMNPAADTHYGLGCCMLRMGMWDFVAPIWEKARLEKRSFAWVPGIPPWNGRSDLRGKRILILREGGYGDIFWLMRYCKVLQDLGARVAFHVFKSQKALLSGHPWFDELYDSDDDLDNKGFDYQFPLWSIMFATEKVPLGMEAPYIQAEAKQAFPGPSVGLLYKAGEIMSVHRKLRSIQPEFLPRLLDVPGVNWVNLEKGLTPEWAVASVPKDLPEGWKTTAEFIAGLDLIITADTGMMHLAGAMGKPTWVFVPTGADWKFSHGTDTTMPWYPSLRIFRNTDPVSFAPVVESLREALLQWVAERQPVEVAP